MNPISESEKKEILSKILNSAEFKDSKRYQDLLQYLVDRSDMDESIKEVDIALDVFGKDANFDYTTNPLIRSYISNLRKKLEHYYLTTEDHFSYKLEIPKGHYKVIYTQNNQVHAPQKNNKHTKYLFISIIIILAALLVIQEIRNQRAVPLSKAGVAPNPIWNEFLQSDYPTMIVLGDYLFLTEKGKTHDRIFVRDPKINNEKDFRAYDKKYPGKLDGLEILKFTYLRTSSPFGLHELLRVLGYSSPNVSIKLASEVKWEDFDKHNIIYLGTFKTLYKLDTLIAKTNLNYSVEPSSLNVIGEQKDTINSFKLSWLAGNYQNDYSTILKIHGSKSSTILFLMGFSEIGVMESVKSVVDPNFITRVQKFLNKNIPRESIFFEMISAAEGVELTSFRSTIKYFNLLP